MLRDKLANDIALKVQEKLYTKTAKVPSISRLLTAANFVDEYLSQPSLKSRHSKAKLRHLQRLENKYLKKLLKHKRR